MLRMILNLQEYQIRIRERLWRWRIQDFVGRLKAKDPSLWPFRTSSEIVDRLGWLNLPADMKKQTAEIYSFREEVAEEDFSHVVLCGMGGSSLAPEVFQSTFGNAPGFPELVVADSTHPQAVLSVSRAVDLDRTLFIVSSKSGTTLETLSLFRYFWDKVVQRGKHPGRQFVAITDPGTLLQELGIKRKFRRIFLASSDVGGRFSALSHFGLVPAALIGLDVDSLLERAEFAAQSCAEDMSDERMSCLCLGAAMGEIGASRDKMTVLTSESLRHFPYWLEQLLAESLGKEGKGIIPVVDEPRIPAEDYGSDRFFVSLFLAEEREGGLAAHLERIQGLGHPAIRIDLRDTYDLAQEIFRWEMAVVSAASIFGVNPFDQPDVELAKEFARQTMEKGGGSGRIEARLQTLRWEDEKAIDALSSWFSRGKEGDYVCIQAFLPPSIQISEAIGSLRKKLLEKTRLASAADYGPRFLHSTGQLHKGGPGTGHYLQLVDEPECRIGVPETNYTFYDLIQAQAAGDYLALKDRKKHVLRVNLGDNPLEGIRWLERHL